MIGPSTGPDACDRAAASAGITSDAQRQAFRKGWNAHTADSQAQKHEQRRYEIARDVLAGIIASPSWRPNDDPKDNNRGWSIEALDAADALLAQLAKGGAA